jgi:alpha-1,3-mannosyltransferase
MKIVHVVRQFHPAVGGLEDVVFNLTRELATIDDVEVTVVTLDRLFRARATHLPAADRVGMVTISRIGWFGSSRYPIAPTVLRAIRDADVVHVHGIDFFFDFLALTRWLHRKPLVASTHGGFFHTAFASTAKKFWFCTITRFSARAYRAILASSESDATQFRRIAPRQTAMAPNGVDTAKWRDRANPEPLRSLLFVGRFSTNKDIPQLVAILGALRVLHPGWDLVVAGQESDLREADVRALIAAAGLEAHVSLAVGCDTETLARLIGQSSYMISASRYEGFGLTMIEGLSAGLDIIMNDIEAFRTLSRDTGRGLVVDMQDVGSAAEAIEGRHQALSADWPGERTANMAASTAYGWQGAAKAFVKAYELRYRNG